MSAAGQSAAMASADAAAVMPTGLSRDIDGNIRTLSWEKRLVRGFESMFLSSNKEVAPAYLAKTLTRQEVIKGGGETKPMPLGPDGKPIVDPVYEEKLKRKKRRVRNLYYVAMFWFLLLNATLIYTGWQYFSAVLPYTRDVYIKSTAGPRVAQRFRDFIETTTLEPIKRINNVMQRGFFRFYPSIYNHVSPINFHLVEAMFGSTLLARRAILKLEMGFEGTRQDSAFGAMRFFRVGPKEQLVLQTDIQKFCTEGVGIFGCTRNMTLTNDKWFRDLKNVGLGTILTQTRLQPTHLDPFVPSPLLIPMPSLCSYPHSATAQSMMVNAMANMASTSSSSAGSGSSSLAIITYEQLFQQYSNFPYAYRGPEFQLEPGVYHNLGVGCCQPDANEVLALQGPAVSNANCRHQCDLRGVDCVGYDYDLSKQRCWLQTGSTEVQSVSLNPPTDTCNACYAKNLTLTNHFDANATAVNSTLLDQERQLVIEQKLLEMARQEPKLHEHLGPIEAGDPRSYADLQHELQYLQLYGNCSQRTSSPFLQWEQAQKTASAILEAHRTLFQKYSKENWYISTGTTSSGSSGSGGTTGASTSSSNRRVLQTDIDEPPRPLEDQQLPHHQPRWSQIEAETGTSRNYRGGIKKADVMSSAKRRVATTSSSRRSGGAGRTTTKVEQLLQEGIRTNSNVETTNTKHTMREKRKMQMRQHRDTSHYHIENKCGGRQKTVEEEKRCEVRKKRRASSAGTRDAVADRIFWENERNGINGIQAEKHHTLHLREQPGALETARHQRDRKGLDRAGEGAEVASSRLHQKSFSGQTAKSRVTAARDDEHTSRALAAHAATNSSTNGTATSSSAASSTTTTFSADSDESDEPSDEELSILEQLGLLDQADLDEQDAATQSTCIGPNFEYAGPRLANAEVYERTTDRKYFLTNQRVQHEILGYWEGGGPAVVQTESRMPTERKLSENIGYSVPVLSLVFKIQVPQNRDGADVVPPDPMLEIMGDLTHIIGRIQVDVTQFADHLRESPGGVFDPTTFEAYVVNRHGDVVCSAFLEEQVQRLPNTVPDTGQQAGNPGMGLIHQGNLPPVPLVIKKVFESEHFSSLSAADLAEAPSDGLVNADGVLIIPVTSSDTTTFRDTKTTGPVDLLAENFYVVVWADQWAFVDTWTFVSSWVKIVLGGYPFSLFMIVTILYSIRECAVKKKESIRQTGLFDSKLRILGPAEIEKDRQKEAAAQTAGRSGGASLSLE